MRRRRLNLGQRLAPGNERVDLVLVDVRDCGAFAAADLADLEEQPARLFGPVGIGHLHRGDLDARSVVAAYVANLGVVLDDDHAFARGEGFDLRRGRGQRTDQLRRCRHRCR